MPFITIVSDAEPHRDTTTSLFGVTDRDVKARFYFEDASTEENLEYRIPFNGTEVLNYLEELGYKVVGMAAAKTARVTWTLYKEIPEKK